MILNDLDLVQELMLGDISIDPLDVDLSEYPDDTNGWKGVVDDSDMIQPSSVDLHLADEFVKFDRDVTRTSIDPYDTEGYGTQRTVDDGSYTIQPGEFVLGNTAQQVSVPIDMRALVHGRSSWARIGGAA